MVRFRAISPKKLQDGRMRLELLNGLRKTGNRIKQDYEKTTKTWKTKPKFQLEISLKQSSPSVIVSTDNEIYAYVDLGTRPHLIKPKRAKRLRFLSGFSAKTRPGVINSFGGGSFGSTIYSKGVKHPGTKPRDFTKTIKRKVFPYFVADIREALNKAARVSGHRM